MRIVAAAPLHGLVIPPLAPLLLAATVLCPPAAAEPAVVGAGPVATVKLTVAAGSVERSNLPLRGRLPSSIPAAPGHAAKLRLSDGSRIDAQIVPAGLLDTRAPPDACDLVFVLPKLEAGAKVELEAEILTADTSAPPGETANGREPRLRWADESGAATLLFSGKPLIRAELPVYDASSEEARTKSYKPFHHVFDPATGIRLTKGDGGVYPHHRGIFFGYNRIFHGPGKKTASDCWHCKGQERQECREVLEQTAGAVAALQRLAIEWIGSDGEPVLEEVREIEALPVRDGTVIEFASRLTSAAPLLLDGDPQHSGVHFRATNEVAETTKGETYYIRPDGKAEPGQFRNWPQDASYVNAPWHAASFIVGGQRYTVLRVNRPANPGEARMSERDYARFGSYFEHELLPDRPLQLGYRFWVQPGELTVDEAARIAADYATPAAVMVTMGSGSTHSGEASR
jgi:hypothetical protein